MIYHPIILCAAWYVLPITKASIVCAEALPVPRKMKKKKSIYITKMYFKRFNWPNSALEETAFAITGLVWSEASKS